MGTKNVLVSYLERNRNFTIPIEKLSDIEYLRKEFLKALAFNKRYTNLLTFQVFEKEWDEFEDAGLADKAKVKAVDLCLGETCSLGKPCMKI